MKENPNSRFVFQNRIHPDRPQLSYHGAWKTAVMKAGIKPCVPYDMRRTKITDAMKRGDPPVFLGMLLDTSVGQIQNTYTKADAEALEALVN
jgi:integrase